MGNTTVTGQGPTQVAAVENMTLQLTTYLHKDVKHIITSSGTRYYVKSGFRRHYVSCKSQQILGHTNYIASVHF